MTTERRQFTRIQFNADAHLSLPDGNFAVDVEDISLKGALVRPRGDLFATVGANGTLELILNHGDVAIRMEVTIVHHGSGELGLACREIDLDSITHLRRLVELNIGDESILNREISALTRTDA